MDKEKPFGVFGVKGLFMASVWSVVYLKVAASAGDGARGPDLAIIDNLHLHPFTTPMSLRPAICRTSFSVDGVICDNGVFAAWLPGDTLQDVGPTSSSMSKAGGGWVLSSACALQSS